VGHSYLHNCFLGYFLMGYGWDASSVGENKQAEESTQNL
jgi:hypothetical protein